MNSHSYSHQQQATPLPPGWVQTIDPSSGRMYYANATTGESSWEVPQLLNVLPPPPPSLPPPTSTEQQYHHYYNDNSRTKNHSHPPTMSQPHSSTNHDYQSNYYVNQPLLQPYQQQQNLYIPHTHNEHPQQEWSNDSVKMSQPSQHPFGFSTTDSSTTVSNEHPINNNIFNSNKTKSTVDSDPTIMELLSLSPGQIADMCFTQQQQQLHATSSSSMVSTCYYKTLIPNDVTQQENLLQKRPVQEMGRLHTRYYTLREQIKQQQKQNQKQQ